MRLTLYFIVMFSINAINHSNAQTIVNASFEGSPTTSAAPIPWYNCNQYSTPDTQPGSWNVTKAASDGSTYISLTTRGIIGEINDNTTEAMGISAKGAFLPKRCYTMSIDLAYSTEFYFNGIAYLPVVLKVYVSRPGCDKTMLVWTSPVISNTDWQTYNFMFTPDNNYTDLILEASFSGNAAYPGNVLIDNLRLVYSELNIDKNVNLCKEATVQLDTGFPLAATQWSNGSTQPTIEIDKGGEYWVEIKQGNCTLRDTVEVFQCCEIMVPNVFTPNNDLYNDYFEVISNANIARYNLKIYDTWGKLIFENNEVKNYWDGRAGNSKEVSTGVYFWYVTLSCITNNRIVDNSYKGTVSVLR